MVGRDHRFVVRGSGAEFKPAQRLDHGGSSEDLKEIQPKAQAPGLLELRDRPDYAHRQRRHQCAS